MLAKPLNLVLVYIVTIFNVMILISPIAAVIWPFINIKNNAIFINSNIYHGLIFLFLFLMFLVSFTMLLYLFLDLLLGFSIRSSLKNCQRYEKIKDFDFLTPIFNQVKDKFGERNVKLYIKNSNEINAFAVSCLGKKAMVLTSGLINHYSKHCHDSQQFLYALRSIMGHEMSHLINKDFLPSFLIMSNQKVTNFFSGILFVIFRFISNACNFIPAVGGIIARIMNQIYSSLNFIITLFNRLIVYNLYEFLRRFVSRSTEYRCDRQSAKAFGGQNMAFALSMLGASGYFTLFSTHPRTKSRMKKVENIKMTNSTVRPGFFDMLANYFSLLLLTIICLYFAKQAHVDLMVREYINNHELIRLKLIKLWRLFN
jgi:Zn-dependent protease with chaperone function